jgi:hypothetical protein
MSPEEREMLEKSLALAEENNKILHSMKRGQRWASIMRVVYWVFIIGSAVGAFYLIQPYIDEVKSMYESVSDGLKGINLNR